jgi:outer membrane lipoprotein-sorting protein
MRKFLIAVLAAAHLAFLFQSASAQTGQTGRKQLSPDEVIKAFTTKESELFDIWKEYSYIQESKMQVLGQANTISGEFFQVSEFVFNDTGKRIERILKAPPSTLDQAGLTMTVEDRNAIVNLQPFALTKEDLPNYQVNYVGKEKVDELNCYVFDVTPRAMLNSRELDRLRSQKIEGKFFQGKIWVDDEDLQIVKTAGKTVPEFKQRFPRFETYRENIDGRYWFPTYTFGDDFLEFDRFRVHVRMVIKYKNYRQFQSDVKLVGVEEIKDETAKPAAKPEAPKPAANPATGTTPPATTPAAETKPASTPPSAPVSTDEKTNPTLKKGDSRTTPKKPRPRP